MPFDYPKLLDAGKEVIQILRFKHHLTYEECTEILSMLELSLTIVQTPKEAKEKNGF